MHYYYLKKIGSQLFVADPNLNPTGGSYTQNIDRAKRYKTKEEAEKDRCGNEIMVEY